MMNWSQWLHDLHQVTGAIALKGHRATPDDVAEWVDQLRKILIAMEEATK
jgi:hypothetical protein